MKCSCAQCRFSAYLDQDLDQDEQVELLEHLEHCQSCAAELDMLRQTVKTLQGLPEIDPGTDFYAGVCDLIHDAGESFDPEKARKRSFWSRLLPDFSGSILRPALGGALGLVAGMVLASSSPQLLAFLNLGQGDTGSTSPAAVYRATADGLARNASQVTSSGPLAGIDLPPLVGLSDTLNLVSDPEYVLEDYVTDPHRGH